jgi:hypothetical protein
MMIHGELSKEGRYYSIVLAALGAYGMGRSRTAACASLAGFIRDMAAERAPLHGFDVTVTHDGEATAYITSNDPPRLLSMMLREQRQWHELSLRDVADRSNAKSRNGYAVYEHGKTDPSLTKLQAMLDVIAPAWCVALVPRTARVIPRWDEEAGDVEEIDLMMRGYEAKVARDKLNAKRAKRRPRKSRNAA